MRSQGRCRVNSAHTRQTRPNSGPGLSQFSGKSLRNQMTCSLLPRQRGSDRTVDSLEDAALRPGLLLSSELRQSRPHSGLGLNPFSGKSPQTLVTCSLRVGIGPLTVLKMLHFDQAFCCRANSAQLRQSRPDSGVGLSHFPSESP